MAPSKNTVSNLLPQKYIIKVALSKNTFFQSYSLKEDIFKIAFFKKLTS